MIVTYDGSNMFIVQATVDNILKLFSLSLRLWQNKPERLSVESFFRLVLYLALILGTIRLSTKVSSGLNRKYYTRLI